MVKRLYQRKQIPKCIRVDLWDKWFGLAMGKVKCPVCKHRDILQMDHEVGHIQAVAKGGSNCINNLVPICRLCNTSMGTMNLVIFTKKWYKSGIRKVLRLVRTKKA